MPTTEEKSAFAISIEEIVVNSKLNYIDAIVEYCSITGMEIEIAATLINPNLKAKIESLASNNNLLKEKSARLPF